MRSGSSCKGRGTHGARPWGGVDPIVVAAQIVGALQTIISRQVDITANPLVITVGAIKGGIRNNIVPDEVEMIGTLRTFDLAAARRRHRRASSARSTASPPPAAPPRASRSTRAARPSSSTTSR